jgi:hypothetical protein
VEGMYMVTGTEKGEKWIFRHTCNEINSTGKELFMRYFLVQVTK